MSRLEYTPSKADEKKFRRLIAALKAAGEAMWECPTAGIPKGAGDSRLRLSQDMAEYASYLEQATWWRVQPTSSKGKEARRHEKSDKSKAKGDRGGRSEGQAGAVPGQGRRAASPRDPFLPLLAPPGSPSP